VLHSRLPSFVYRDHGDGREVGREEGEEGREGGREEGRSDLKLGGEELVGLVHDHSVALAQIRHALICKVEDASWGAHLERGREGGREGGRRSEESEQSVGTAEPVGDAISQNEEKNEEGRELGEQERNLKKEENRRS